MQQLFCRVSWNASSCNNFWLSNFSRALHQNSKKLLLFIKQLVIPIFREVRWMLWNVIEISGVIVKRNVLQLFFSLLKICSFLNKNRHWFHCFKSNNQQFTPFVFANGDVCVFIIGRNSLICPLWNVWMWKFDQNTGKTKSSS